jgi:adaptin ear-binding coat-associated protein 1/2
MDRDPITGEPVPSSAIQRILYIAQAVHIYRIPPITSTRGFNAANWTANPADHIFTARLRIVETAIPPAANDPDGKEKITANILLEDPSTSQLFAAVPYTHPSAVEQALDSSRFFAVRVVGEGGMKATLGIGFEQRPEAFEYVVTLQDVRRTLGLEGAAAGSAGSSKKNPVTGKATASQSGKDLSLKDGEMITINIGGKGKRTAQSSDTSASNLNSFAILPPPPSAASVKAEKIATESSKTQELQDMGFDDGEFGEFQ